ncbi:MAG: DUF2442 domain-containing protein [Thermodesulfobacteriota bacterium]
MNAKYIAKAIPLRDFTLILLFESGELRILDMKPYIRTTGVWGKLGDWDLFSSVEVQEDLGGLVWPEDLDYCPDSAFMDSQPLPLSMLKDLIDVYWRRKQEEAHYEAAG